jgi:sugar diacid utilization regulator
MIDEVQEIVDSLARRIGHTVYIDDSEFRTLAYSTHVEEPDAARLSALAGRVPSEPMRDYLERLGVRTWHAEATLAADPAMGIDYPRRCFPLRSRYGLLGFIWIIVARELEDDGRAEALAVAERLATLLTQHTEQLAETDAERARLVRELLSDGSDRAVAVRGLGMLGMFADITYVVTIIGEATPAGGRRISPAIRRAIASATALRPRNAAAWTVEDDGSAIVLGYRASPPPGDALSVARAIHRELATLDRDAAAGYRWGVGAARPDLAQADLSADQARAALRVAASRVASVVAWDDDPVSAGIAAWTAALPADHLVPEALRRLPDTQSAETLALVRAFLDRAGNVVTVAADLYLHRTTVYERLRRFEETTGLDLRNGAVRLALHLWLISRD